MMPNPPPAPVATWLELAAAPPARRRSMNVRIHPIGNDEEQCFSLTVDGRCLCAGSGALTIFKGRPAVERFLRVARVERFEFGPPEPRLDDFPSGYFCLALDCQGLRTCETVATAATDGEPVAFADYCPVSGRKLS